MRKHFLTASTALALVSFVNQNIAFAQVSSAAQVPDIDLSGFVSKTAPVSAPSAFLTGTQLGSINSGILGQFIDQAGCIVPGGVSGCQGAPSAPAPLLQGSKALTQQQRTFNAAQPIMDLQSSTPFYPPAAGMYARVPATLNPTPDTNFNSAQWQRLQVKGIALLPFSGASSVNTGTPQPLSISSSSDFSKYLREIQNDIAQNYTSVSASTTLSDIGGTLYSIDVYNPVLSNRWTTAILAAAVSPNAPEMCDTLSQLAETLGSGGASLSKTALSIAAGLDSAAPNALQGLSNADAALGGAGSVTQRATAISQKLDPSAASTTAATESVLNSLGTPRGQSPASSAINRSNAIAQTLATGSSDVASGLSKVQSILPPAADVFTAVQTLSQSSGGSGNSAALNALLGAGASENSYLAATRLLQLISENDPTFPAAISDTSGLIGGATSGSTLRSQASDLRQEIGGTAADAASQVAELRQLLGGASANLAGQIADLASMLSVDSGNTVFSKTQDLVLQTANLSDPNSGAHSLLQQEIGGTGPILSQIDNLTKALDASALTSYAALAQVQAVVGQSSGDVVGALRQILTTTLDASAPDFQSAVRRLQAIIGDTMDVATFLNSIVIALLGAPASLAPYGTSSYTQMLFSDAFSANDAIEQIKQILGTPGAIAPYLRDKVKNSLDPAAGTVGRAINSAVTTMGSGDTPIVPFLQGRVLPALGGVPGRDTIEELLTQSEQSMGGTGTFTDRAQAIAEIASATGADAYTSLRAARSTLDASSSESIDTIGAGLRDRLQAHQTDAATALANVESVIGTDGNSTDYEAVRGILAKLSSTAPDISTAIEQVMQLAKVTEGTPLFDAVLTLLNNQYEGTEADPNVKAAEVLLGGAPLVTVVQSLTPSLKPDARTTVEAIASVLGLTGYSSGDVYGNLSAILGLYSDTALTLLAAAESVKGRLGGGAASAVDTTIDSLKASVDAGAQTLAVAIQNARTALGGSSTDLAAGILAAANAVSPGTPLAQGIAQVNSLLQSSVSTLEGVTQLVTTNANLSQTNSQLSTQVASQAQQIQNLQSLGTPDLANKIVAGSSNATDAVSLTLASLGQVPGALDDSIHTKIVGISHGLDQTAPDAATALVNLESALQTGALTVDALSSLKQSTATLATLNRQISMSSLVSLSSQYGVPLATLVNNTGNLLYGSSNYSADVTQLANAITTAANLPAAQSIMLSSQISALLQSVPADLATTVELLQQLSGFPQTVRAGMSSVINILGNRNLTTGSSITSMYGAINNTAELISQGFSQPRSNDPSFARALNNAALNMGGSSVFGGTKALWEAVKGANSAPAALQAPSATQGTLLSNIATLKGRIAPAAASLFDAASQAKSAVDGYTNFQTSNILDGVTLLGNTLQQANAQITSLNNSLNAITANDTAVLQQLVELEGENLGLKADISELLGQATTAVTALTGGTGTLEAATTTVSSLAGGDTSKSVADNLNALLQKADPTQQTLSAAIGGLVLYANGLLPGGAATTVKEGIARLSNKIAELQATDAADATAIQGYLQQISNYAAQVATYNQTINANAQTIDQLTGQVSSLTEAGAEKDQTITTLSADTAAKAQQIAMLTTATQAKDDQITTLSGEVGVLSNQVQTINATANTLKSDAAQVTLQLDDAAASLIDAGNNVAAAVGGDTSKSVADNLNALLQKADPTQQTLSAAIGGLVLYANGLLPGGAATTVKEGIARLSNKIAELQATDAADATAIQGYLQQISDYATQVATYNQTINANAQTITELGNQLASLTEAGEQKDEVIAELTTSRNEFQTLSGTLSTELNNAQAAVGGDLTQNVSTKVADLTSKVDAFSGDLTAAVSSVFTFAQPMLNSSVSTIKSVVNDLGQQILNLQHWLQSSQNEASSLHETLVDTTGQLDTLHSEYDALSATLDATQTDLQTAESTALAAAQKLDAIQTNVTAAVSDISATVGGAEASVRDQLLARTHEIHPGYAVLSSAITATRNYLGGTGSIYDQVQTLKGLYAESESNNSETAAILGGANDYLAAQTLRAGLDSTASTAIDALTNAQIATGDATQSLKDNIAGATKQLVPSSSSGTPSLLTATSTVSASLGVPVWSNNTINERIAKVQSLLATPQTVYTLGAGAVSTVAESFGVVSVPTLPTTWLTQGYAFNTVQRDSDIKAVANLLAASAVNSTPFVAYVNQKIMPLLQPASALSTRILSSTSLQNVMSLYGVGSTDANAIVATLPTDLSGAGLVPATAQSALQTLATAIQPHASVTTVAQSVKTALNQHIVATANPTLGLDTTNFSDLMTKYNVQGTWQESPALLQGEGSALAQVEVRNLAQVIFNNAVGFPTLSSIHAGVLEAIREIDTHTQRLDTADVTSVLSQYGIRATIDATLTSLGVFTSVGGNTTSAENDVSILGNWAFRNAVIPTIGEIENAVVSKTTPVFTITYAFDQMTLSDLLTHFGVPSSGVGVPPVPSAFLTGEPYGNEIADKEGLADWITKYTVDPYVYRALVSNYIAQYTSMINTTTYMLPSGNLNSLLNQYGIRTTLPTNVVNSSFLSLPGILNPTEDTFSLANWINQNSPQVFTESDVETSLRDKLQPVTTVTYTLPADQLSTLLSAYHLNSLPNGVVSAGLLTTPGVADATNDVTALAQWIHDNSADVLTLASITADIQGRLTQGNYNTYSLTAGTYHLSNTGLIKDITLVDSQIAETLKTGTSTVTTIDADLMATAQNYVVDHPEYMQDQVFQALSAALTQGSIPQVMLTQASMNSVMNQLTSSSAASSTAVLVPAQLLAGEVMEAATADVQALAQSVAALSGVPANILAAVLSTKVTSQNQGDVFTGLMQVRYDAGLPVTDTSSPIDTKVQSVTTALWATASNLDAALAQVGVALTSVGDTTSNDVVTRINSVGSANFQVKSALNSTAASISDAVNQMNTLISGDVSGRYIYDSRKQPYAYGAVPYLSQQLARLSSQATTLDDAINRVISSAGDASWLTAYNADMGYAEQLTLIARSMSQRSDVAASFNDLVRSIASDGIASGSTLKQMVAAYTQSLIAYDPTQGVLAIDSGLGYLNRALTGTLFVNATIYGGALAKVTAAKNAIVGTTYGGYTLPSQAGYLEGAIQLTKGVLNDLGEPNSGADFYTRIKNLGASANQIDATSNGNIVSAVASTQAALTTVDGGSNNDVKTRIASLGSTISSAKTTLHNSAGNLQIATNDVLTILGALPGSDAYTKIGSACMTLNPASPDLDQAVSSMSSQLQAMRNDVALKLQNAAVGRGYDCSVATITQLAAIYGSIITYYQHYRSGTLTTDGCTAR